MSLFKIARLALFWRSTAFTRETYRFGPRRISRASSTTVGVRNKSAPLLRSSGLGFGDAKSIHELCAVRACRCRHAVAVAHRHAGGTVPLDVAPPVFHLEARGTLSVRYGDGGAESGEKKKKGASSPHCYSLCKRAAGGRFRMPTMGENRKSRCARQGW